MYLILRNTLKDGKNSVDYFGPFPTEDRAKKYAESFADSNDVYTFEILPIIVPNCVQVKLMY